MIFKLSNLALTLGYLNPALNNSAQLSNLTGKTVTLDDLEITDANRFFKYEKLSVLLHSLIDRGSL